MKSTIFWDITPCNPLKVNQRFGGTYHLHLQGRRISQARNQYKSRWQAELCLTFNRLHGIISQKIILFRFHIIYKPINWNCFVSVVGHCFLKQYLYLLPRLIETSDLYLDLLNNVKKQSLHFVALSYREHKGHIVHFQCNHEKWKDVTEGQIMVTNSIMKGLLSITNKYLAHKEIPCYRIKGFSASSLQMPTIDNPGPVQSRCDNGSVLFWDPFGMFIMSRFRVTVDGYWIDNWIYCTSQSITHNRVSHFYNQQLCKLHSRSIQ
jgi:hypothetical protein